MDPTVITDPTIWDTLQEAILPAVLAAIIPTAIAGWAWLKANAAKTPNKIDDKIVEFFEEVAARVVAQKLQSKADK